MAWSEKERKNFRAEIRKELNGLPRENLVWFAWRCALRVLPVLGSRENFDFWQKEKRQVYLLVYLGWLDIPLIYLNQGILEARQSRRIIPAFSAFASDAAAVYALTDATGVDPKDAAFATPYIVADIVFTGTLAATEDSLGTLAVTDSTHEILDICGDFIKPFLIKDLIKAKQLNTDLNLPLWDEKPAEVIKMEIKFRRALEREEGEYWYKIYKSYCDGKPDFEELKRRWAAPREVFIQGVAGMATYLEKTKEGVVRHREVKVVFLGQGASGKTSIVRKLLDIEAPLPDEDEATLGVDTPKWHIRKQKILAHLWDFGGQIILHNTHRFFLSVRNLYVIVADTRQDDHVEYWLKHAQTYGEGSPVLVVRNKVEIGELTDRFSENELRRKYPQIKGFFYISCKDLQAGDGFARFRDFLIENLKKIQGFEVDYPTAWFAVKTALGKLMDSCIDKEAYEKIFLQNGIEKKEEGERLLDFLNSLGIALHYPQVDKGRQVLKPEWLTRAVYGVITSKTAELKHGKITKADLSDILNLEDYPPNCHGFILSLMEKFELCFRQGPNWIVPDRLPNDEPDSKLFQAYSQEAVTLQYRATFVRSTVMRLIVRLNQDVDLKKAWRKGCVFENKKWKSSVMAIASENREVIDLWAKGEKNREYLNHIRNKLDAIYANMPQVKPEEYIPLYPRDSENSIFVQNLEKEEPIYKNYNEVLIGYEVHRQETFFDRHNSTYRGREILERYETENMRKERIERIALEKGTSIHNYYNPTNRAYGGNAHAEGGNASAKAEANVSSSIQISIEIKNENTQNFSGVLDNLIEDAQRELPENEDREKLLAELDRLKKIVEQLQNTEAKDKNKARSAMDRLEIFMKKIGNGAKRAGKLIQSLEDGAEWGEKLVNYYNQFAPFFDYPPIPNPFNSTTESTKNTEDF